MSSGSDSSGLVSEDELKALTELYVSFEGCPEPRTNQCKEAEIAFNQKIDEIYARVHKNYESISRSKFLSYVRNVCRERYAKSGPPFPCP
jgi:hypothetical protein